MFFLYISEWCVFWIITSRNNKSIRKMRFWPRQLNYKLPASWWRCALSSVQPIEVFERARHTSGGSWFVGTDTSTIYSIYSICAHTIMRAIPAREAARVMYRVKCAVWRIYDAECMHERAFIFWVIIKINIRRCRVRSRIVRHAVRG